MVFGFDATELIRSAVLATFSRKHLETGTESCGDVCRVTVGVTGSVPAVPAAKEHLIFAL